MQAIVEYDVGSGRKEYLRFQLLATDASVRRPADLDLTATELLWDLVGGPLFRPG